MYLNLGSGRVFRYASNEKKNSLTRLVVHKPTQR
jgi:hypothetical protein